MATIVFVRPLLLILVLLATILTAIALFTPGWRGSSGLIAKNCHRERESRGGSHRGEKVGCDDFWDNQPGWLRTVIALMILAFIIEMIILIWTGLSFLGICVPRMHIPLAFLCALAALLLIISVIVFAAGDGRQIMGHVGHAHLGYSFWLAVLASITMVLATIAAGGVVGLTKTII